MKLAFTLVTALLLARRLVKRGTRYVQIYYGAKSTTAKKVRPNFDSNQDVVRDHGYWGPILDDGAAALHLLALNHEKPSCSHNGIERRLTDVRGHVIKEIVA